MNHELKLMNKGRMTADEAKGISTKAASLDNDAVARYLDYCLAQIKVAAEKGERSISEPITRGFYVASVIKAARQALKDLGYVYQQFQDDSQGGWTRISW